MSLQKPANSKGTFAKSTIGLLLVCVVAAAMLVAARRPAGLTPTAEMDVQQAASTPLPAMPEPAPKKAVVSKAMPKPPAAAKAKKADVVAMPVEKHDPEPVLTSTQISEAEIKPVAQESTKLAAPAASPVTISGCLERDGDGFALKDTTGLNAPKSRSWKSGFLKKGAAKIELLDSGNRLKFKDHVGHRISVTGILNDREMQARSMQRIAGGCE